MVIDDITTVNARRENNLPRTVPLRLSFQITNACDSHCSFCHIWTIYRSDESLEKQELSAADWLTLAANSVGQGIQHIDLTGGEPFLKDGFEELAVYILRSCKFTCVTTNALQTSLISTKILRILRQVPPDATFVVSVSLDGMAATHDALRGTHLGFEKAVSLLRWMSQMKLHFSSLIPQVSFTISDKNYHDLIPLADFLLSGKLIESPENFTFRPVQTSHYYRRVNKLSRIPEIVAAIEQLQRLYSFGRNALFINGIKNNLEKPRTMLLPCYAMFVSCWIDPYGNVAPCVTWTDKTVGNVRDTGYDIAAVWNSRAAADLRRAISSEQCPICWTDCQAHDSLIYSRIANVGS